MPWFCLKNLYEAAIKNYAYALAKYVLDQAMNQSFGNFSNSKRRPLDPLDVKFPSVDWLRFRRGHRSSSSRWPRPFV
jgi:hypothetical protein